MIENTEEKYVGTWILGQYRIERVLDTGGIRAAGFDPGEEQSAWYHLQQDLLKAYDGYVVDLVNASVRPVFHVHPDDPRLLTVDLWWRTWIAQPDWPL